MRIIAIILLIASGCNKPIEDVRNIDRFSADKGALIYKSAILELKIRDRAFNPFDPNQAAKIDSAYKSNYSIVTGQK
mgnify:FL=1